MKEFTEGFEYKLYSIFYTDFNYTAIKGYKIIKCNKKSYFVYNKYN